MRPFLDQPTSALRLLCVLFCALGLLLPEDSAKATLSESETLDLASELRALRQEVAQLRERLDALESEPVATAPVPPAAEIVADPMATTEAVFVPPNREFDAGGPSPITDLSTRYFPSRGRLWGTHFGDRDFEVEVGGFVDLEYIDAGPDGSRSGVSTFDNHHANLFLRSMLGPNLLAHVEIEYEHSGEVVEIDQAFLAWGIHPALTLKAGRFYTPFGIERFAWYSPANALVSRPTPMRQIIPGNFYANGLVASGVVGPGQHRFQYEVALSDGLGDDALDNRRGSRQARDNNSNRAFTGRVAYTRWPNLEVGASLHQQRYSSQEDLDLRFQGFDLATRWNGFELRAEWVEAEIEQGLGLPDREESGWYAQLQYVFDWDRTFLPSVTLVGRWNDLDLDRSVTDGRDRQTLSFGLNFEIYSHVRFKLEAQQTEDDGLVDGDDDAFLSQFVFEF